VYEGGWVARNQTELAMRIEQKIKTFDQPFFQRLFRDGGCYRKIT
jgi:hypothetical protein